MKKLIVIIGESGSGKTTLTTRLVEKYPNLFKRIITCTSRSKRVGEIDGIDYHFLPIKYFTNNPDLVLVSKSNGIFHYGTRRVDLFSQTHHLLLTSKLTGVQKLVNLGFSNIVVVHISISEKLKINRMRQRGDTEEMIAARLQSDRENESVVDLGNIPRINLEATQTIDDKVTTVVGRVED